MSRKNRRKSPKPSKTTISAKPGRQQRVIEICNRAARLAATGDRHESAALFRKALSLEPRQTGAMQHLAMLENELGNATEAVSLLERSLKLHPRDPICHNNLGNVLRGQGAFGDAIAAYKSALALDPNYVNALYNIGVTLLETPDSARSLGYLEQAARLAGDDIQIWESLGKACVKLQIPDAAAQAFKTVLKLDPGNADACTRLAGAYLEQGDLERARDLFKQAVDMRPDHPNSIEHLARSRKFTFDDRAEIERVEHVLQKATEPEEVYVLNFALGKMYDDCGDHERAFQRYHAGNQIRWTHSPINIDAMVGEFTDVIATFSAEFFERRVVQGSPSELPVFITGLPRSGTTLVEQILASHPLAAGAGEVPFLNDVVMRYSERQASSFPQLARDLTTDAVDELAREYLSRLTSVCPGVTRASDKALSNGMFLGLIACLFPNSHVIYCRRNPLNTGLSMYFQRFATGTMGFAYDLSAIGTHCREYARLMHHWDEVLPLRVHVVDYEKLVADQENTTRALVDYCGLPWHDRCLSFFETERNVHTASHWQVRKPIYKDSVNKAQSYSPYIDELKRALGDSS